MDALVTHGKRSRRFRKRRVPRLNETCRADGRLMSAFDVYLLVGPEVPEAAGRSLRTYFRSAIPPVSAP
jgi:hypothetical protein